MKAGKKPRWIAIAVLLMAVLPGFADAHEVRPGLLEITERDGGWFDVTWKVPTLGGRVLALLPVLPDDLEILGAATVEDIPGAQIQRATYRSSGEPLTGKTIFIEGLSAVQTDVLLSIEFSDGTRHSTILRPGSPSFTIPDQPSAWDVVASYWRMGTLHILEGIDHLLFVLALMLIVSGYWMLFKTITAFTVSHSISLGLATLGFINIPQKPTEAIIALSILFLAVEIVHARAGRPSLTARYPWVVAFIFGLFHGLGFASALHDVGLPQQAIPLALLMFNLGVETGQILFVAVVVGLTAALKKLPFQWPEGSWRVVPYAIGGLAAFWTIERMVASFGLPV